MKSLNSDSHQFHWTQKSPQYMTLEILVLSGGDCNMTLEILVLSGDTFGGDCNIFVYLLITQVSEK